MTGRDKFDAAFMDWVNSPERGLDLINSDVQIQIEWKAWQAALASQKPADDGWIDWAGGECPVNINSLVNVRYRNGGGCLDSKPAEVYNWSHNDEDCYPIIAYRVVKP